MNTRGYTRVEPAMRVLAVALMLVWGLASSGHADDKRPPKAAPAPGQEAPIATPKPNECAKAEPAARYIGYGYTHAVVVRNTCPRPVVCTVWTDVDPEPKQTVHVSPGEAVEVVTRRGSPARALAAFKDCSFP